jgi:hypothetical protein
MMVPTLYVCQLVERSRREDERREAKLWRLLHPASRPRGHNRGLNERTTARTTWGKDLVGSPSL